jgi:site-specific DNA-methyltransferase (cytosine-N4-specific)
MLWAEAETALGRLRDASIQLLFTSPPYPILHGKEYGVFSGEEYVERLCRFFRDATRVIADDGSLVLNLMDCQAQPKVPTLSLYKEKLLIHLVERCGYHLCQNFFWSSPCKIPAGHWVTVRRQRVNSSVEHLFWLAKTPFPKVHQMEVLRPYSPRMQGILTRGGERRSERPSGHGSCRLGFSRDHGGSIPGNLLSFPNGASNTPYHRFCRRHNLPRHPARFPMELPSFFIRLLTDPGDVVWDCFAGSNTTGKAAESLGRRWVSSEKALAYAVGSQGWFDMVPA